MTPGEDRAMTHTFPHNRRDAEETEVVVEYTYHPGRPEQGPTYDCGGQPAEPPEVEIVRVTAGGVEIDATDAELEAWTTYALENCEDDEPDPDYLRDLMEDRKYG
jgi:hypothetical protein